MIDKNKERPLGAEEREIVEAFITGRPDSYEREKGGSTVLSVRLPRSTLKELTQLARAKDKPVGRVARELIEEALASQDDASSELLFRAASRAAASRTEQPAHGLRIIFIKGKGHFRAPEDVVIDREIERFLNHERIPNVERHDRIPQSISSGVQ